MAVAGVAVTVADDAAAGVSVSATLSVAEGGSAAYTVVLDALPSGNVVIGVTISGSPDVTVDRATLTFSPSNWDTAQTVTVCRRGERRLPSPTRWWTGKAPTSTAADDAAAAR